MSSQRTRPDVLTVAAQPVSLFAVADAAAELETECLPGERFAVERVRGGWCQGYLDSDGYQGWVETRGLCASSDWRPDSFVSVPLTLATDFPSIKSRQTGCLPFAPRLCRVDEQAGRVAVLLAGQTQPVWVPATHVQALADSGLPRRAMRDWVSVAESFLHAPYRWGGRSVDGLDCSALVQLALFSAGVAVPRNSSAQLQLGQALSPGQPVNRGDLVFWPGHVGIMLDGLNLLHANAYHMQVAIEPLEEAARRIAGPGPNPETASAHKGITSIRRLAPVAGSGDGG